MPSAGSAPVIALLLLLPAACVAAMARPRRRIAERIVLGLALYEALLLVMGVVLGLAGWLRPSAYAASTLGAIAWLAWRGGRNGVTVRLWRPRRWLGTRRGAVALAIAAGVLAAAAVQLAADVLRGTRHSDGLWYHVPRILAWAQQGSFSPWPTPTWQQIGLPVGADVVLGAQVFLGLGWAGTSWVTFLLVLGAVASVYVIAIDLGLDRWRAAMAALLFASFPAVGARVWTLNSDIAAAFPVLAAYVALRRARDPAHGLAAFVLLNALGVACKPTVAPLAVAVAALALLRERRRLTGARTAAFGACAAAGGLLLVLASYWPVYLAFHDFTGGAFGRLHAVRGPADALRSVIASAVHWTLEPLGYLPQAARGWLPALVDRVYRPLGVFDVAIPADPVWWQPLPAPDSGRSGVATILALPWLARAAPRAGRRLALAAWVVAFVAMSGMVYAQPWSGRFTIVLLAGFALFWAAPRAFRRGAGARLLAGVAAVNTALLLATTLWLCAFDARRSSPGGAFAYLEAPARAELASVLGGAPLWVVTGGAREVLLAGPGVAFPLRYLLCPADGDWATALRGAAAASPALAVVHEGRVRVGTGPTWPDPGAHRCGAVDRAALDALLAGAGWRPWLRGGQADVWLRAGALEARAAARGDGAWPGSVPPPEERGVASRTRVTP